MACERKLKSESSKVHLIRGKEINVRNHHFLNLCFRRFKALSFSINSRQEKWVFKNSVFPGIERSEQRDEEKTKQMSQLGGNEGVK